MWRKKLICKLDNFILVFIILPTLSPIDLHPPTLPNGRTTSLYCQTIFGWLLRENSSVGGHLRPQCISFSFIFGCSIQFPKQWYQSFHTPPACCISPPYSPLLQKPIFGWLLCGNSLVCGRLRPWCVSFSFLLCCSIMHAQTMVSHASCSSKLPSNI